MEGQGKWPWDKKCKGVVREKEFQSCCTNVRGECGSSQVHCCYLATDVRVRIFARAGAGAQVLQDPLLIEWLAGISEPLTLPPQHLRHHLIPLSPPLLSSHSSWSGTHVAESGGADSGIRFERFEQMCPHHLLLRPDPELSLHLLL